MSRKNDLSGMRFGKLTVLNRSERKDSNNAKAYWDCICECGKRTTVHRANLLSGRTISCGCIRKELAIKQATKHNGSGTRLYRIWSGMHSRCYNSDIPQYQRYGGRGISVCAEWRDFSVFKQWAESNGYSSELTLDRIDNYGDYSPQNCRWATKKKQANNTSKTTKVEWNGVEKSLGEWADVVNIPRQVLWKRIKLRNWSVEKALTTPLKNNGYSKIKEDK